LFSFNLALALFVLRIYTSGQLDVGLGNLSTWVSSVSWIWAGRSHQHVANSNSIHQLTRLSRIDRRLKCMKCDAGVGPNYSRVNCSVAEQPCTHMKDTNKPCTATGHRLKCGRRSVSCRA